MIRQSLCFSLYCGTARRVSENLTFDDAGRVVSAEVFHGVAADRTPP